MLKEFLIMFKNEYLKSVPKCSLTICGEYAIIKEVFKKEEVK